MCKQASKEETNKEDRDREWTKDKVAEEDIERKKSTRRKSYVSKKEMKE